MNKPGTYLVSLSAYVKNYDVAVFQIAVKKGEHNNIVTLYSFDGASTISKSTIYHLDHGDEISVEILSADGDSKLTNAMISIFALTTPDCPSSKFTRNNKNSHWRCDGDDECDDGSDERG